MLTVRYERLGLQPGDLLLDLGSGFGRHAYEAARRGATVVALDAARPELAQVSETFEAMHDAGEVKPDAYAGGVQGDATHLPFPDATFERIVASEVFEHIPDDRAGAAEVARVLKPGGVAAVTVPSWFPEQVCWWLSDEYHAPFVEGGHVRIYTEPSLRAVLRDVGLKPGFAHRAHALHSPYWWLRCAVGPTNDTNPLVAGYRRLLEWDIVEAPAPTRMADRLLNPVLGKSLVVYAKKPA